jgi:hypothetical protein
LKQTFMRMPWSWQSCAAERLEEGAAERQRALQATGLLPPSSKRFNNADALRQSHASAAVMAVAAWGCVCDGCRGVDASVQGLSCVVFLQHSSPGCSVTAWGSREGVCPHICTVVVARPTWDSGFWCVLGALSCTVQPALQADCLCVPTELLLVMTIISGCLFEATEWLCYAA